MHKILVTGAGGFIGSHLTETLVQRGYAVKAFVQYNSHNDWGWLDALPSPILNEIEVFSGDIRDPFGVKKAMEHCHKVLHLAALIGIPYSYHSPENYIETNVKGTLNVVQAAREWECEAVIHTSTSEVYGTAQYVPINEQHPLQPQSPYSASKIAADQIALSYYYAFNTPVTVLRPFNTYGPRQSARAVIPTIITQISHGAREIKLGSLEPTRDFSYVQDTVNAYLQALECPAAIGKILNLGSQYEISIANLISMIGNLMQKEVQAVRDPVRIRPAKSEVERLWADHTLAKHTLNWQPEHLGIAGLQAGLEKTIAWFLQAENTVRYKTAIYNV